MDKSERIDRPYIRRRILIPMITVGAGIIILFCMIGKSVLDANVERKINHELEEVDELFMRLLRGEARGMEAQLALISRDRRLQDAWAAQDEKELLKQSEPIFKALGDTFQITHFYYMNLNRECILRVHAPNRAGDVISRYTMMEAERTRRVSSGIELGPLGTFTLRVVVPWTVDGKLVGYLELGEEIGHLTPQLGWVRNLDVIFTIDKSRVERENWEEGCKIFGHAANWAAFDDFVVMDKTFTVLPNSVATFLKTAHSKAEVNEEIVMNGRTYWLASKPLNDTSGETVGRMIVSYDTTRIHQSFQKALMTATIVAICAAGVLLGIFYVYTGKIDAELRSYRTNLEELVATRTAELQVIKKEVKEITGFLPICSYCKKIRDDKGYWNMLELYISQRSDATFEHCICESCLKKHFPGIDEMRHVTDDLNDMSDKKNSG